MTPQLDFLKPFVDQMKAEGATDEELTAIFKQALKEAKKQPRKNQE